MTILTVLALSATLGISGRASATPTVAAADSFVVVAFGGSVAGGATDVYAAVSRDGGRTFAQPVRVNAIDGDARLNGEQPPQVSLVTRPNREPAIIVVWTTKGGAGTKLVHARSDDGGKSFSATASVPGSDAAGNRGWEASTAGLTIWLDHRELANDSTMAASHHDHQGSGKPDGVAMAQKSKLFVASLDGRVAPHSVTGGVCYCGKTALVVDGGSVYAAWRHVYPGNLRDMAFAVSRDGGRTFSAPLRVSEDQWKLEGCPDDGPSMAVDADGRVHLVWPTLVPGPNGGEPSIAIFYAMSPDGSRFGARFRLPAEGVAHHPRMVLASDGSLVAAWDESSRGSRRVVVARAVVDRLGKPTFKPAVIAEAAGVYPALASTSESVVVVWTSGSQSSDSTIKVSRLASSNRTE